MADPNWAAAAERYAFGTALPASSYAQVVTLDALIELARNDTEGDWANNDGLGDLKDASAALVDPELIQADLDPVVAQMVEAGGKNPSSDPDANWRVNFDYMVTNSDSFDSMEWSMGTPSAGGSNVGNMTVARLSTDEDGEPMEAWWADTYTLEAESDYLNGAGEHAASWSLKGTAAGPDGIPFEGAPKAYEQFGIPQLSDKNAVGLSNASFGGGTFSGTTITALTGWAVGSAWSNFETNTTATYYYLDTTASGGTPRSVRFTANDYFYQELNEVAGFTVDSDDPWRFGVWFYRRDTMTGTFTIRLTDVSAPTSGGVSRAVTIGGLSDNAWTFIDLVATPGQNNWPKNFRKEQLCVSYQVASLATGTCYVSNAVQAPWTRIGANGQTAKGRGCNGQYVSILAGSTQTIKGDLFTWADSAAQTGVNQEWSGPHGSNRGYAPSTTGGTETVADK